MRVLAAPQFGPPSSLQLLTLPSPTISSPHDILVSVHCLGLNRSDALRMSGWTRIIETLSLPFIIGADFSGVIAEVGDEVKEFKAGDRVYGFSTFVHGSGTTLLHLTPLTRHSIYHLPPSLSFEEGATCSSVCTAFCALSQAESIFTSNENGGEGEGEGEGLKGKTVLVIGALGAVGSTATMVLKRYFGVKKVIVTVSKAKVALVNELLGEGTVDQIVDYTTQDVVQTIGKEKVDFMFDSVGTGLRYIEVMKKGGVVLSVIGKSSKTLRKELGTPPRWMCMLADTHRAIMRWRAGRWGVEMDFVWNNMDGRFGVVMEKWAEEGSIRPLVGRVIELKGREEEGMREIRAVLEEIGKAKGTVGKTVVRMEGLSD